MQPHSRPQDLKHPCSLAHRRASWEVHTDENCSLTKPGAPSILGNQETPQVLALLPVSILSMLTALGTPSVTPSHVTGLPPAFLQGLCLPVCQSTDAWVTLQKKKNLRNQEK